jgi:hypothetical protein
VHLKNTNAPTNTTVHSITVHSLGLRRFGPSLRRSPCLPSTLLILSTLLSPKFGIRFRSACVSWTNSRTYNTPASSSPLTVRRSNSSSATADASIFDRSCSVRHSWSNGIRVFDMLHRSVQTVQVRGSIRESLVPQICRCQAQIFHFSGTCRIALSKTAMSRRRVKDASTRITRNPRCQHAWLQYAVFSQPSRTTITSPATRMASNHP